MIKKVRESSLWKDPVFSKNWSQVIWGIAKWLWSNIGLVFATTLVFIKSIPFKEMLIYKVEFYWVIAAAILPSILKWIFKLPFKSESKEDKIKKFVSALKEIKAPDDKFLWKFDVVFYDGLKVTVDHLRIYCTDNHPPIKMTYVYGQYVCSGCRATFPGDKATDDSMEDRIVSHLEDQVEKAKMIYKV